MNSGLDKIPVKEVIRVMGKIIDLGQITTEKINIWPEKYEKRDDSRYCTECHSRIMQCICFVSIHLKAFEPSCAGTGQVIRINYPYCPTCDGEIVSARACLHVPVV